MTIFHGTRSKEHAAPLRRAAGGNHVVHFYDEREAMVQSAAAFLAGGLLRGAPGLVIVAADRADAMRSKLAEMGVDLAGAQATKQLVLLDSEATLARLLERGMPDEQRFRDAIGSLVAALVETWRPMRLHAYGDMVDVLYTAGNAAAAIELERLWDDVARRHAISLYCAYDGRRMTMENDRAVFDAICRHHDEVLPLPEHEATPGATARAS